jgi:hypothetical protein
VRDVVPHRSQAPAPPRPDLGRDVVHDRDAAGGKLAREPQVEVQPGGLALIGDIPEKGKLDFDMMGRYSFLKKLYMVPITIAVDLVIQKRYTQAEVLQTAAEMGLVARIVRQPTSLPFYASRFDVLLSHE